MPIKEAPEGDKRKAKTMSYDVRTENKFESCKISSRTENVVMIIPTFPLGSLKYNYQAAALKPTREEHFHTAHT